MADAAQKLRLDDLGPNEQAAVRLLLDDFRSHGWRDQGGGAIAIVRALASDARGLTTRRIAQVMPEIFFVANSVSRTDVRKALDEIAVSASRSR